MESKLSKKTNFKPSGEDVTATKVLIILQSLDFLGKLIFLSYNGFFIMMLQALFTIPLLSLSTWLYFKFKYAFSLSCMKHIVLISTLMIIENGMNLILRAMVGLKSFLSQQEEKSFAVINLVIPIIFATLWMYIRFIAESKDGHYGAPLALMKKFEYDPKYCESLDQTNQFDHDY